MCALRGSTILFFFFPSSVDQNSVPRKLRAFKKTVDEIVPSIFSSTGGGGEVGGKKLEAIRQTGGVYMLRKEM